jgi:hypothetical protein
MPGPLGDLPALRSPTAWVHDEQHMAGDNFPTHAHRGGWAADSSHRDRAVALHTRTRFAPAPGPTSDFRLTVPALPENVAVVRRVLECVAGVHGLPADVVEDVRSTSALEFVRAGDTDIIAAPLDFLGINYYTRHVVAPGAYPGSSGVEFLSRGLPVTAMGWEVDPDGLYDVVKRVHDEYPTVPIFLTENGSAYDDVVGPDGQVDDPERLAYLRDHLGATARLIADGVDVRGYFAWSLMDNFEWAYGYAKRFGLVHVDYTTQVRTPKASARWYAALLDTHRNGTGLASGILGA